MSGVVDKGGFTIARLGARSKVVMDNFMLNEIGVVAVLLSSMFLNSCLTLDFIHFSCLCYLCWKVGCVRQYQIGNVGS